jgi:hypothetical protein
MRYTWRFYVTDDGRWRWQKLGNELTVVTESSQSFDNYESCVAAATKSGYVFEATQARFVRPGNDDRSWRRH